MKQPLFLSTIGTQSHFAYFLTVEAVVRKFGTLTPPCRSPPQGRRSPTTPWGMVTM